MTAIDTTPDQQTVILLVIDDPPTRAFLAEHLSLDEYRVLACDKLEEAAVTAAREHPDVALVDVNAGSGIRFARAVRAERAAGVNPALAMILLGSKGGELEALRSLDAGADDYVAKPFSYPELRARVRALLRRCDRWRSAPRLRVGTVVIDVARRTVIVAGEVVELTRMEFELLRHLAREPTRVFTKDELLRSIWGWSSYGRTRTLDSHACRLRRKLAAADRPMVNNIWGVGYRLISPEPEAAAARGDARRAA